MFPKFFVMTGVQKEVKFLFYFSEYLWLFPSNSFLDSFGVQNLQGPYFLFHYFLCDCLPLFGLFLVLFFLHILCDSFSDRTYFAFFSYFTEKISISMQYPPISVFGIDRTTKLRIRIISKGSLLSQWRLRQQIY